jgi:lipoprotein NlpD
VAWTYVVQSGDTFVAIARRMGVSMAALAAENRVPLPYLITQGQVLRRPAAPGAPGAHSPHHPQRRCGARRPPRPRRRRVPCRPRRRPMPARQARRAWSGRLRARSLARYGVPQPGGRTNNGIDLAAFAGMSVHAAAAGKVIFAGNEPERFGQLIVIDHGGGWVTAYAYLGRIDVKQGSASPPGNPSPASARAAKRASQRCISNCAATMCRAIRRPICRCGCDRCAWFRTPPPLL